MRVLSFSILLSLITFCGKAQSSDVFTATGVITVVQPTNAAGIDKFVLDVNGDTLDLIYYYEELYEDSLYLNKKVKITYIVKEILKEVDMFANGSTVYTDRKKVVDTTKALKVEGLLDIYDLGCSMPGKYFIKSKDSSVIAINHYVSWKYQKPHEFKNVTVYYTNDIKNMILDISFVDPSFSTLLDEIPEAFFKQTGISKANITTKDEEFASGCVIKGKQKPIKLNSIKTKKNTQIISLTYGGKQLYTKEYHLKMGLNRELIIKEVK